MDSEVAIVTITVVGDSDLMTGINPMGIVRISNPVTGDSGTVVIDRIIRIAVTMIGGAPEMGMDFVGNSNPVTEKIVDHVIDANTGMATDPVGNTGPVIGMDTDPGIHHAIGVPGHLIVRPMDNRKGLRCVRRKDSNFHPIRRNSFSEGWTVRRTVRTISP